MIELYPRAEFTPLIHNFSTGGAVPKIIALHGTSGLGDPYNYWNNPATQASADLWVPRAGPKIKQYVKFGDTSWSNGPLVSPDLTIAFLRWLVWYQKTHPTVTGNTWTLSIEFEKAAGNNQPLTMWQVSEGTRLLRWISEQFAIPLDRQHVLGHYQFDSVNRPFCPRLSGDEWAALLYNDVEAENNFWAPTWHAAGWALANKRISAAEASQLQAMVVADKIRAGVQ